MVLVFGPKVCFQSIATIIIDQQPLQFQHLVCRGNGNLPIQDWFLWLDRFANGVPNGLHLTALQGLDGVIYYLDDILVVTKGSVEDLKILVEAVMKRLDAEGWALKLSKFEFSVNQLVWLGHERTVTLQTFWKLRP